MRRLCPGVWLPSLELVVVEGGGELITAALRLGGFQRWRKEHCRHAASDPTCMQTSASCKLSVPKKAAPLPRAAVTAATRPRRPRCLATQLLAQLRLSPKRMLGAGLARMRRGRRHHVIQGLRMLQQAGRGQGLLQGTALWQVPRIVYEPFQSQGLLSITINTDSLYILTCCFPPFCRCTCKVVLSVVQPALSTRSNKWSPRPRPRPRPSVIRSDPPRVRCHSPPYQKARPLIMRPAPQRCPPAQPERRRRTQHVCRAHVEQRAWLDSFPSVNVNKMPGEKSNHMAWGR